MTAKVSYPSPLHSALYLCLHTGSIVARKPCADALGTSTATVASHLIQLEQANLIYRLPPPEVGGKRVVRAQNKYCLADPALRNAVLPKGEEIFTHPDEMALISETTVFRHLCAHYYRYTPEIVCWRDLITQKEVDIIVRSPKCTFPVEVKYQDNRRLGEKSGLVAFRGLEPVEKAYWVTRQDKDLDVLRFEGLDTDLLKVPAHILRCLLGQAERSLWISD